MTTPTPYTGTLVRTAHFAYRPPVPGINPDHEHPQPEPDPFNPVPPGADQGSTATVWQPQDLPVHTDMRVGPRPHSTPLQPPVPSNVHGFERDNAATARMLANHALVEYRPDKYPTYKHATQGVSIDWYTGREPRDAGISVPDNASFLVMGKNAFDATNSPNEVYSGDAPNVGRYRLQANEQQWGLYDTPQARFGQDGWLRAYEGLSPQFPADKPRVPDSAPYTPNSSGTTTWLQSQWQVPSLFALPSETATTDFQTAAAAPDTSGSFDDGGRL
jgi:hypothetical protein